MQRQANTIGLVVAVLVAACVPNSKTPAKPSPPRTPVATKAPVPAPEKIPVAEVPQEWCFDTTTVSKSGSAYKSNICLSTEDQCSQLAKHYKKTGGLIGVEYIAECKVR